MSSDDADSDEDVSIVELEDMRFEGPDLDVPGPPDDLPYEAHGDERSRQLLAANGIPLTDEGLLDALHSQTDVLLAAAAHASGSSGARAAVPALVDVAHGPDDYAAVEAAYALVRLGDESAAELLRKALHRPLGAYLSPVLAAGYLAQVGDPSGHAVVGEALGSEFLAVRMLGCKQLLFLMPYHGKVDSSGETIDVMGLFERALGDPERSIQGEALVQLRSVEHPAVKPLLARYVSTTEDDYLRRLAQEIIDGLRL